VANWKQPRPLDTWNAKERGDFEREIWTRVKFGRFDWEPSDVSAVQTRTFTVGVGALVDTKETTGLRVGMPVRVTPPAIPIYGLYIEAAVLTDDILTIAISNTTLGDLTPPPGAWSFMGVVI
jgi:hypothetical protein